MFGGGGDAPVANGECRVELLTGVGRGKRPILPGCACLSRSRFRSAGRNEVRLGVMPSKRN
jgi:hypothetical protein